MASAAFENARKDNTAFMAAGIRLRFPAFDDLPEKTIYLGTRRFEGDGENYVAALAEMPQLRSQRGLAQDTIDFSINDPNSEWYESLKPYEDVIEDTEIISKEFLKTADGVFESEIVLTGVLDQMTTGDKNLAIDFSGTADLSRTGVLIGGRILTQRYCAAIFNKFGLPVPPWRACTWQLAQGGNPLFCTHKLKGVDGCEDHLNEHQYYAVEALSTAEITIVPGDNGGGGFDYGTCLTPNTLIWTADGGAKPIYRVEIGDLVWSFTASGKLVKSRVVESFAHTVDRHLVLDFGNERFLEVTPEHLILTGDDNFTAAGLLDAGNTVRSRKDAAWTDFVIRNNWLKETRTRVHNFHVENIEGAEKTETYFVVVGDRKIGVHNRKDDYGQINV